jgi:aspartate/methionine/tyrosine aminotransferase
VQQTKLGAIREVANAGLGRDDVLAFWFGESDEPTPAFIRQAAVDSLARGETFYAHNLGLPALREAIAAYMSARHGGAITLDRIAVTSGGVNALMLAAQALVDPGSRVVAVTPLWPNLIAQARIGIGGAEDRPRRIPQGEAVLNGRKPSPELFAEAGAAVAAALRPMEDINTSAAYRRELAATLTERALEEAAR